MLHEHKDIGRFTLTAEISVSIVLLIVKQYSFSMNTTIASGLNAQHMSNSCVNLSFL